MVDADGLLERFSKECGLSTGWLIVRPVDQGNFAFRKDSHRLDADSDFIEDGSVLGSVTHLQLTKAARSSNSLMLGAVTGRNQEVGKT